MGLAFSESELVKQLKEQKLADDAIKSFFVNLKEYKIKGVPLDLIIALVPSLLAVVLVALLINAMKKGK